RSAEKSREGRNAVRIYNGEKRVRRASGEGALKRAHQGKVSRFREARDIGVAGRIDGDCMAGVIVVATEVSGIKQRAARCIELGNEPVRLTLEGLLECILHGEVRRKSLAGHIGISHAVYRDRSGSILIRTAQERGIHKSRATALKLRYECVACI